VLFVLYQRGDSGVPLALSKLHCSSAIISLEIDAAARSKELLYDGRMPTCDRDVEWSVPILCLNVDITVCNNETLRDGLMPISGRQLERPHPSRPGDQCFSELQSAASCRTHAHPDARRYNKLQ
jgi:hypothetical protein